MVNQNQIPLFYTSILYFCGFFLFLEWLYPIKEVTETSSLAVFIVYASLCFFLSLFRLKWWTSFLIKGTSLMIILHWLFLTERFLSKLWFKELFLEFANNIQALLSQDWYDLTPFFRTLLFLLIIWVMSYLIHYWFVLMRRIFLFVFFTFLYLAILDTFTIYDAKFAIIRTFLVSFIALGMAHFFKEVEHEDISFSWMEKTKSWAFPLVIIVLLSSVVGYVAPSFNAQWPDPVPFIKSVASGNSGVGSGVRKVGYGNNDTQLGGSFIQDFTPIFQASTTKKQYWRIETKDVYTGKGWERSTPIEYEQQDNGIISLETYLSNVETEELTAIIDFHAINTIDKLVYPYGIRHVEALEGVQFLLDSDSGFIQSQIRGENASLDQYTITYHEPRFSIEALRDPVAEDPDDIKEQYTTLPESLPDRIGELAEEITSSLNNRYDKTRAIERYFNRNGFEYQTEDVPYPEGNQDYVDQFLFETKIGYCDNYSTSMVVMLRSLNIPARWVKGFSGGEEIGKKNGMKLFEITNANAHSWVEVYFPNTGWVPFEPTQGFDNLSEFRHTTINQEDRETPDIPLEEIEEQIPEQEMPIPDDEDQGVIDDAVNQTKNKVNKAVIVAPIVIVLLVSFIAYKTRFRWKTMWIYWKLKKNPDLKTFEEAYFHLLHLLGHYTFARRSEQTLREYAEQIDLRYETNKMGQLTNYYEQILYNNVENNKVNELIHVWKSLIDEIRE